MASESDRDASGLEELSAMSDGEVDAAAAARACGAWRADASMRSAWHTYQLIGDVLRSDDLASSPARDAEFLASLRTRLASEPTVLAPEAGKPSAAGVEREPIVAVNGSGSEHRSWVMGSAAAAGVVLVVGAVMVMRVPLQFARAPALAASDVMAQSQSLAVDGKVVRDAQLDQYLAAHKQFSGSTVLGVPSAFLRNAAVETPGR